MVVCLTKFLIILDLFPLRLFNTFINQLLSIYNTQNDTLTHLVQTIIHKYLHPTSLYVNVTQKLNVVSQIPLISSSSRFIYLCSISHSTCSLIIFLLGTYTIENCSLIQNNVFSLNSFGDGTSGSTMNNMYIVCIYILYQKKKKNTCDDTIVIYDHYVFYDKSLLLLLVYLHNLRAYQLPLAYINIQYYLINCTIQPYFLLFQNRQKCLVLICDSNRNTVVSLTTCLYALSLAVKNLGSILSVSLLFIISVHSAKIVWRKLETNTITQQSNHYWFLNIFEHEFLLLEVSDQHISYNFEHHEAPNIQVLLLYKMLQLFQYMLAQNYLYIFEVYHHNLSID
ncbi:hypothetical protein AGLY_011159 [Aphis glycines]|uniref:Uncharacterized protein n=1 Tax=Aphis glycines TaxID=307491 RepID=A0A6G0TEW1_APHGL|nr:hypothetical protein AGLY_011159 [Aphis glycines]